MNVFKIYPSLIILLIGFLAVSCGTNGTQQEEVAETEDNSTPAYRADMPESMKNGIESIGGIEKWNSYNRQEYDLKSSWSEDHQLIDLKSRKVKLSSDKYTVGFDGEQVWVTPSKDSIGNARFYSSLFFYFLNIPYVFNDNGVIYEDRGRKTLDGKEYDVVSVSFESGIGDADKDEYIAYFNPETGVMEWLLYTVTYHEGKRRDQYNALNYVDWTDVGGVQLPGRLLGYKFQGDSLGDQRYEASFENIIMSVESPDQSLFEIPEGAEIDSLKTN